MRLFIEFTNINMYEIIENGDYILTIGQPVPHMVADPNQLEREREREREREQHYYYVLQVKEYQYSSTPALLD